MTLDPLSESLSLSLSREPETAIGSTRGYENLRHRERGDVTSTDLSAPAKEGN